jgi:hypothetical protein
MKQGRRKQLQTNIQDKSEGKSLGDRDVSIRLPLRDLGSVVTAIDFVTPNRAL